MNWYGQGKDNDVQKAEKARQETMYGPERLWLKPGSSINTVFLDDVTFDYREWQFRKGQGWRGNHITDPGSEVDERAEVIEQLGEPKMISMLTVIDLDGWKGNKGDVMDQYRLLLLPLKSRGKKKIDLKREAKDDGLIFRKCVIMRTDDKSPNSGDDFDFDSQVTDLDKMFTLAQYKGKTLPEIFDMAEKDEAQMKRLKRLLQVEHEDGDEKAPLIRKVVPFNYYEILKPLTGPGMMERIQGHNTPTEDDRNSSSKSGGSGGSGGNSGGDAKTNEVPF